MLKDKSILLIGECMIELSPLGQETDFRAGFAGDTFNTAWYLRRLLSAPWGVEYFTAVGDDRWSDQMLDFMTDSGVETDNIVRIPGRSPGLYIVSLQNGERSFSYWRSNSAARGLMDDCKALERASIGKGVIFFSGITLAILPPARRVEFLAGMEKARQQNSVVVFDPNIRPHLWETAEAMKETISKAAGVADIVLPSFDDEQAHFGDRTAEETIDRYAGGTGKIVVVKNGGGEISTHDGQSGVFHFTPRKVDAPVDTTAAGDAFNAGFLASYLVEHDLEKAVEKGAALAGRMIMQRGALVPLE